MSATKRRRCQPTDYTIAWICALPIEQDAAIQILDDCHDDIPLARGDSNTYTLGRVGNHNVAIACLPVGRIGTSSAAITATMMRHTFPSLRYYLLVGVGAGVPSDKFDIRLGDVVVSQPNERCGGVIQHDFGKIMPNGEIWQNGSLNGPPRVLLNVLGKIQAQKCQLQAHLLNHLASFRPEFSRNVAGSDVLFKRESCHKAGMNTCEECTGEVVRPQREFQFVVHYGTIASGNQVMRDGIERDKLSAKLGNVLCFEMEAAGLMNDFAALVIRGICDYGDSHKNKRWQPHAAATAAVFAKEVLLHTPCSEVLSAPQEGLNPNISKFFTTKHTTPTGEEIEEQRQYIDSLSFDQMESRHDNISVAYFKTCKWLLEKEEFKNWRDPLKLDMHNGFLWIRGNPGTGKSTIMKFAFSQAKTIFNHDVVISFFFNARGENLEKSVEGMYRSLLSQIFAKLPDLRIICNLVKLDALNQDGSYYWTIKDLESLFRCVVQRLGKSSLTCFIDALDECQEDQVRKMILFFETLGETAVSSGTCFYICFSSRHYPYISIDKSIDLILEDQEEHQQDITTYVEKKLKAGRGKIANDIRAEIIKKASGIFLWVVLVVGILNEELDKGQLENAIARISEIPSGLHDLFKDILMRDNKNLAELILCLQWVLYARRPLRLEELYFAVLAGQPQQATRWKSSDITAEIMRRFILNSSKGLTEVIKSKKKQNIQFIHESVSDFLMKENGLGILEAELAHNSAGLCHEKLKQCCQNYITSSTVRVSGLVELTTTTVILGPRDQVCEDFPFLEYAVENILYHADSADSHEIPQNDFIQGFDLNLWVTINDSIETHRIRRYGGDISLLYILSERGFANLVRIEVERVQTMNPLGGRYGSPIFAAVIGSHNLIVEILLDNGADITLSGGSPKSDALAYAIHKDKKELIEMILSKGADDYTGYTGGALIAAALRGSKRLVERLLAKGIDVNAGKTPIDKASTALIAALLNGNEQIANILLDRGANVNTQCRYHDCALTVASENRYETVVKTLLDKGADVNAFFNDSSPLCKASERGYEAITKLLLERGADINLGFPSPLRRASERGHESIVKLLLDKGSDLNADTNMGFPSPLYKASEYGHEAIIKILLDRGADANADANMNFPSPLCIASERGHEAVTKLLLDKGANVNGVLPNSLSRASYPGYEAMIELLLDKGAGAYGDTVMDCYSPLFVASREGHEKIVKLLLDAGANANTYANYSFGRRSALQISLEGGHERVVEILRAHGAME